MAKLLIKDIYETDPIKVGDKVHTRPRKELEEFYTSEELDKMADKDFVVTLVDSGCYYVKGFDRVLIDDDIAYVERD